MRKLNVLNTNREPVGLDVPIYTNKTIDEIVYIDSDGTEWTLRDIFETNQEILNAFFEEGTDEWFTSNGTTFTVVDEIATFLADSQYDRLSSNEFSVISGNEYFVIFRIKTSSASVRGYLYDGASNLTLTTVPSLTGDYELTYGIVTVSNTTDSADIRIIDSRTSGFDDINVDFGLCIPMSIFTTKPSEEKLEKWNEIYIARKDITQESYTLREWNASTNDSDFDEFMTEERTVYLEALYNKVYYDIEDSTNTFIKSGKTKFDIAYTNKTIDNVEYIGPSGKKYTLREIFGDGAVDRYGGFNNDLVQGNFAEDTDWTHQDYTYILNGFGGVNLTDSAIMNDDYLSQVVDIIQGHKYFTIFDYQLLSFVTASSKSMFAIFITTAQAAAAFDETNFDYNQFYKVFEASESGSPQYRLGKVYNGSCEYNLQFANVKLYDLTSMFDKNDEPDGDTFKALLDKWLARKNLKDSLTYEEIFETYDPIDSSYFDEDYSEETIDSLEETYNVIKNAIIEPELYVPTEPVGLGNRFKFLLIDDTIYGHEFDFENIVFKMHFGVNYNAYKGYNILMNMLRSNKAVIEYDWGIGSRYADVRLKNAPKKEKDTANLIISKFTFKMLNPFYEIIDIDTGDEMINESDLDFPVEFDLNVTSTTVSIKLLDESLSTVQEISLDFTGVSTPFTLTIEPETKKLMIDEITNAYDYVDHTKNSFIYLPADGETYTLSITGATVNEITYKKWVIA